MVKYKKYLHAHPSHVNAFWYQNLKDSGLKPVDCFLLKESFGFPGDSGMETMKAKGCLEELGFEVILGFGSILSSIHGHNIDSWFDPSTYDRVVTALTVLEFKNTKFFIDIEPYFEGQRYPENTIKNQRAIYDAAKNLRFHCKKKNLEMLIMPGSHHSYAFTKGFLPMGKYALDEGTYEVQDIADPSWKEAKKRWSLMRKLKIDYWPGFFAKKILDRAFLEKTGAKNIWFYLDAHPEKYWLFGTHQWLEEFSPE